MPVCLLWILHSTSVQPRVPIILFYTRDKFVYHIIGGVQYTSINYPLSYPSRSLVNRICKVQDEFHKSKAYGFNGYFNGYSIRGYINKGKFVINLDCWYGPHLLVSLFIKKKERGWSKGRWMGGGIVILAI